MENREVAHYLNSIDNIRAMTIALAFMSENIDITHINIPKACNNNMFTIHSKDGKLDASISFVNNKKQDIYADTMAARQALVDVLNYIRIEDLHVTNIPIERSSNTKNINSELAYLFYDTVAGYMDKMASLPFRQQEKNLKRLSYLEDCISDADKPSRELHALNGAYHLFDDIIYSMTHEHGIIICPSDALDSIDTGCKDAEKMVYSDKYLEPSKYSYTDQLFNNNINIEDEKEKSRLIALALLTPPMFRCGILRFECAGNQLQLRVADDGHNIYLPLDRPTDDADEMATRHTSQQAFKEKFYRMLYDKITGHTDTSYPSIEFMERIIYKDVLNVKKANPERARAILLTTSDLIMDANYNHDEKLLQSAILQCMSLCGKNAEGLPNLQGMTKEPSVINRELDRIYDINSKRRGFATSCILTINKKLKAEITARQPKTPEPKMTVIKYQLRDFYFENGLNTKVMDAQIKPEAVSTLIKMVILRHKKDPDITREGLLEMFQILLGKAIGSACERQHELGWIDQDSTTLPTPNEDEAWDYESAISYADYVIETYMHGNDDSLNPDIND